MFREGDFMHCGFFKRFCAFLLDYFILTFLLSIVTMGINVDTSKYQDDLNDIIDKYANNEITINEYSGSVSDLNYKIQRANLLNNIASVVLTIGYFVIFTYLNMGQTLGKKILKLRIVKDEDKNPSIINILVRSLFLYGIISSLFNVIFISFLKKDLFISIYSIIGNIESIIVIISAIMVLYRKDKRSLYDMIAKTNVIMETR